MVVGPATYASTRGLIEYEVLPDRELKGKELPIASWRAVWLARLAYRIRDAVALDEARAVQARHGDQGGLGRQLEARWADALAAEDADELEAVAGSFHEDVGNRLYAAEALVDAALVEARAGRDTGAMTRARAAADDIGLHPLLGPLPETPWLSPSATHA